MNHLADDETITPVPVHSSSTVVPIVDDTQIEGHLSTGPNPQYKGETCGSGRTDGKCSCRNIEKMSSKYVYAIGRIECRFPRLSVEKEFAQATGRSDTAGLTDRQVLHSILSQKQNRYLARQMCWAFTIEGLETYILKPRDPLDAELLIESLRPNPQPNDIDVVIGVLGPLSSPEMCNGLKVPIVIFDQLYSFDVNTLIKSIPKPEKNDANKFRQVAEELFWRVMQMADNHGTKDEHRALNYLAVRYHSIYAKIAESFAANSSLSGVEARISRLSGVSKVVDVIFSFTNRQTDVTEKYFVRVDVTDEFPFLVTKLSPFYER